MVDKKSNIENLFKENLSGLKAEPSDKLWKSIEHKLWIRNFLKFNPIRFNVYYAAIILSSAVILWQIGSINQHKTIAEVTTKKTSVQQKNSIPDNAVSKIEPNLETNNKSVKKAVTDTFTQPDVIVLNNSIITDSSNANKQLQHTVTSENKTTAMFEFAQKSGCAPFKITLTNRSKNSSRYLWDLGNGTKSAAANPTVTYTKPGNYTIKLTAFGNTIETYTSNIQVYDNPVAKINFIENLHYQPSDKIYLSNLSENASKVLWSFGNNESSYDYNAVYQYNNEGKYTIKLKVWNQYGCPDSTGLTVFVKDTQSEISFPDAFSPSTNGSNSGYYNINDKTNDVFYPVFKNQVDQYLIRIYNRYGLLLFESDKIEIGWDGYYQNKLVPLGVYIYQVKGKFKTGKTFNKTGNITVIYN